MKPLAERVTQGVVAIEAMGNLWGDELKIADLYPTQADCYREGSNDEREANILLIQEAFNVTHETGKTPRELADENEKLKRALRDVVEYDHGSQPRARKLLESIDK